MLTILRSLTRICSAALLFFAGAATSADVSSEALLLNAISKVDAEAFDAFNRCSDPAELKRHESYFSPDVEFYHDAGGVTWDRASMLANTAKNACGKYRRELIPGTLTVFPIKDFGAIAQGSHQFCSIADGRCDGRAEFTIIWRNVATGWQITRVLSYGHRPN